jgi:hypothetical protein
MELIDKALEFEKTSLRSLSTSDRIEITRYIKPIKTKKSWTS